MTEELKPCPFCGGKAIFGCEYGMTRMHYYRRCTVCGARGPMFAEDEGGQSKAIAAWNRRPPTIPADVGRRAMEAHVDATEAFLEAQDALDNRELQGPNAEDYFTVLRRRNAARRHLDAAITELQQALAAPSGGQREGQVE